MKSIFRYHETNIKWSQTKWNEMVNLLAYWHQITLPFDLRSIHFETETVNNNGELQNSSTVRIVIHCKHFQGIVRTLQVLRKLKKVNTRNTIIVWLLFFSDYYYCFTEIWAIGIFLLLPFASSSATIDNHTITWNADQGHAKLIISKYHEFQFIFSLNFISLYTLCLTSVSSA